MVVDVLQGKLIERRDLAVSHVQIESLVVSGLSWIGGYVVVKRDLHIVNYVAVSEILWVYRRHCDYHIGAVYTQ